MPVRMRASRQKANFLLYHFIWAATTRSGPKLRWDFLLQISCFRNLHRNGPKLGF